MGHSTKTLITSETNEWYKADSECGVSKTFHNQKSGEIWLRLHAKKCPNCDVSKRTVYNNHPMSIIDLQDKRKDIVSKCN